MKTNNTIAIVVIVVVGFLAAILLMGNQGNLSTTGQIVDEQGNAVGAWADKIVNYKLLTTDAFTGADRNVVYKVYSEKPADWLNPRGSFTDSSMYTVYTAASGAALIDQETPGTYYAVGELSGYNTEFVTFEIPDGSGRTESLPDYQAQPDAKVVKISAVGTTTDTDFAFTLVNGTDKDVRGTVTLAVADNTKFVAWKAIIDDTEGFSTDSDGDGIYDEGIKSYKVIIGGKEIMVFDPARGIDLFDSNDQYTLLLDGVSVADGEDLSVKVEIVANTGDYTGANDEVWGEGESVLSFIKIYDAQSNLFATVDVTA